MEVRISSKKYECERFGLTELADLQDWLQERREDKIIKRAKKVYDVLPDKIFDEINKQVTLDDLEDAIASDVRSIGYLIYLTVKKSNPSITEGDIFKEIGDIESAMQALGDISPEAGPKKKESLKA